MDLKIHKCYIFQQSTFMLSFMKCQDKSIYSLRIEFGSQRSNLTEVRPLFSLSLRGSYNPSLLSMFSSNYIDQLSRDLYATKGISKALTF